jgi:superfamily II DNA or RNA helicase
MYYSSNYVNIEIGNTVSRVAGQVPSGLLEEVCNQHLPGLSRQLRQGGVRTFDAGLGLVLTGMLPRLRERLLGLGITANELDTRTPLRRTHPWRLRDDVELRDYQWACVDAVLRHDQGILAAGTGAGKTLMGAALIAASGVPTLWVTTSRILLEQAAGDLERYLGVAPAVCGNGRWRVDDLTVALVQALDRRPEGIAAGRFGLLIFDEGHHAAARTCCATCLRVDARRNYFLTAVPERESEDQVVLDALTGGVVAAVAAHDLVEQHWLCPLDIRFTPVCITGAMTELRFTTVYRRFVVENDHRNHLVAADARAHAQAGETVLVLVNRVDHGHRLLALLPPDTAFAHGEVPRRELARLVADFAGGRSRLLVATTGLFAEGVNIEGTSCIVYAAGLRSRTRTLQAVGRGMRLAPGKDRCLYQDYLDQDDLGRLLAHSRRRRDVLAEAGFVVPVEDRAAPRPARVVPSTWTHVEGTKRFLRVSAQGEILERAECLDPDVVPRGICRRCGNRICKPTGER